MDLVLHRVICLALLIWHLVQPCQAVNWVSLGGQIFGRRQAIEDNDAASGPDDAGGAVTFWNRANFSGTTRSVTLPLLDEDYCSGCMAVPGQLSSGPAASMQLQLPPTYSFAAFFGPACSLGALVYSAGNFSTFGEQLRRVASFSVCNTASNFSGSVAATGFDLQGDGPSFLLRSNRSNCLAPHPSPAPTPPSLHLRPSCDANDSSVHFNWLPSGAIRHSRSGKCVRPSAQEYSQWQAGNDDAISIGLELADSCTDDDGAPGVEFRQLAMGAVQHVESGLCWEAVEYTEGGSGAMVVLSDACEGAGDGSGARLLLTRFYPVAEDSMGHLEIQSEDPMHVLSVPVSNLPEGNCSACVELPDWFVSSGAVEQVDSYTESADELTISLFGLPECSNGDVHTFTSDPMDDAAKNLAFETESLQYCRDGSFTAESLAPAPGPLLPPTDPPTQAPAPEPVEAPEAAPEAAPAPAPGPVPVVPPVFIRGNIIAELVLDFAQPLDMFDERTSGAIEEALQEAVLDDGDEGEVVVLSPTVNATLAPRVRRALLQEVPAQAVDVTANVSSSEVRVRDLRLRLNEVVRNGTLLQLLQGSGLDVAAVRQQGDVVPTPSPSPRRSPSPSPSPRPSPSPSPSPRPSPSPSPSPRPSPSPPPSPSPSPSQSPEIPSPDVILPSPIPQSPSPSPDSGGGVSIVAIVVPVAVGVMTAAVLCALLVVCLARRRNRRALERAAAAAAATAAKPDIDSPPSHDNSPSAPLHPRPNTTVNHPPLASDYTTDLTSTVLSARMQSERERERNPPPLSTHCTDSIFSIYPETPSNNKVKFGTTVTRQDNQGPPLSSVYLTSVTEATMSDFSSHTSSGNIPAPASGSSRMSPRNSNIPSQGSDGSKSWVVDFDELIVFTNRDGSKVLLGEGAQSKVYKGELHGQVVALKEVRHSAQRQGDVRGMLREMAIVKRCEHANVLRFYGAAFGDQELVLVFEYMEGGDLFHGLHRFRDALMWNNRGKLVALEIARGMAYLHRQRIIHCDLKSLNVLLTRDGTAKIGDMGMSKIMLNELVTRGNDRGTWAYAAPELVMESRISEKVDIYSFGVILWEIVTGQPPARGAMRSPRTPEECPEAIAELIRSCWKSSPDARPTANQLVSILEQFV